MSPEAIAYWYVFGMGCLLLLVLSVAGWIIDRRH